MMTELIRATIKDIQALLEIEKTTIGLRVYSGYYNEKEIEEWIANEIVYLIKKDGMIVGSIAYEIKDNNHAHISGLVVKTEFQKQGLAREAMNLLFEELKEFKQFSLTVHPDNHAIKPYESFGFIVESRKENYFGDGEPRLIMSKVNQAEELEEILKNNFSNDSLTSRFIERIKEGKLTRDENPKSHLCTYFAAYDPKAKQVFIGHHKKSGLWLFNGGHIDEGEVIRETLIREINEEWGLNGNDFEIKPPVLLTVTEIKNSTKQPCNFHYDLWYFISVDKYNFKPVEEKLLEEFYEAGWKNLDEARSLIKDKNTLLAVDFVENNYFNK